MIRAEKHEVESIAASCATGLERAWAENDALRDRLERAQRAAAEALDMVEAQSQQLADCCPELTIRKVALLGMFAGGLLGFAAAWVAWSVTG